MGETFDLFIIFILLRQTRKTAKRHRMAYLNDHLDCHVKNSHALAWTLPLNVKVHYKRRGPGHEWWFMASLQNGDCNRWLKKCLKLATLPWDRAHSSLSIPKTSMPLVWIGQRRSRKSTERYFSCSWCCIFTSSFTHLWALLLRIAHSYLKNTAVFGPTAAISRL